MFGPVSKKDVMKSKEQFDSLLRKRLASRNQKKLPDNQISPTNKQNPDLKTTRQPSPHTSYLDYLSFQTQVLPSLVSPRVATVNRRELSLEDALTEG